MSLTPFYVICGLLCLFWLLVHRIMAAHLDSFRLLVFLFISVFFTMAGDVLLSSFTGSDTVKHLVVLLAAPAVIPLTCLYLAHINRPLPLRPTHFLWIVIPAMLFTAGLILTSLKGLKETDLLLETIHSHHQLGYDNSFTGVDRTFYIWTIWVFRIVMMLEALDMVLYCIVMLIRHHFKPANWAGFLFKGRKIHVMELQMTLSLFFLAGFSLKIYWLYTPFFSMHPAITVVVILVESFLLFFFGLFGLFGSREYITREDISSAFRFNYSRENKSAATEALVMDMVEELNAESLTKVISRIVIRSDAPSDAVPVRVSDSPSLASALFKNAKSWDEGSLVSRFQRLMTDEQLFLQPGLILDTVAARLKSNKTYISKMVNQTYGIGFPEVLNILRVDYAQQYMRKHEDASQEETARASGFLSASSFNTVFKRITGYTPKVWASRK